MKSEKSESDSLKRYQDAMDLAGIRFSAVDSSPQMAVRIKGGVWRPQSLNWRKKGAQRPRLKIDDQK